MVNKMMNKLYIASLVLLIVVSCTGRHDVTTEKLVRIAISKAVPADKYQNYIRWIKSVDSTITCIDLYHLSLDSAMIMLEQCDGLLLTGGPDVHPGNYGKESDSFRCQDIDLKRDSLEFALLARAFEKKMPVQGICRGLQLINVYFGGSLIIDIPSDLDTLISHQLPDTYECYHEIVVDEGSLLSDISEVNSGSVNSNHHQGIEVLAPDLTGMAKTGDGLIEAIGFKNPANRSYLIAVQWHPERLDYSNALSGTLAIQFVNSVKSFHQKRR